MKNIYIVDGSSFAYRAFYAVGKLSTQNGLPTNAIYGFIKILKKLLNTYRPDYIVITFDTGKPTFRHKQFEAYKAHRKPTPDELIVQIPWIKKIIKAFNIPLIEMEGYEADDIIATMAVNAEKENFSVYIVTGDKDLMQLVNSNIKVLNMSKEDIIYDKNKVIEKYGVEPAKIIQFLAITGDSSDNIPGVDGVGEKTAAKLLQQYGDIAGIFSNVEHLSPKLKTAINEKRDQVIANLELVSVKKDLDLGVSPEECRLREPNLKECKDIFRELEFKALLKEVLEQNDAPQKTQNSNILKINKIEQLDAVIKEIGSIYAISIGEEEFSYEANNVLKTIIIDSDAEDGLKVYFLKEVSKILQNEKIKKYAYDLKTLLKGKSFNVKGSVFDVYIAETLLDVHLVESSSGFSADVYRAVPELEKKLIEEGLIDLYKKIELPLVQVLAEMENRGIKLDIKILQDLLEDIDRDLEQLTKNIYLSAGEEFNINSPKQLEHILFEKMKFAKGRKTKTGFSTDVDVLEALSKYHELPKHILEYRQLSKLKGTYLEPLPKIIDPSDQRLHTTFNQVGTVTGRLSSSNPNLQNIPIKTELGKQVRKAFVPGSANFVLIGADYSQIELRVLAHLSEDPTLIKAFQEDKDIHSQTAQEIFGIDMSAMVTSDLRRQAKIVNFGIVYGMGSKALSVQLGISMQDAQKFIDTYLKRYPKVSEYIDNELNQAKQYGYVATMFGRKRKVPELTSGRPQIESFGKRIAVNTPIQGSAADIIKIAMINIYNKIKQQELPLFMLLQVHDELIFETPGDSAIEMEQFIKKEMEDVVKLRVPLKVDTNIGKSWADL
jgi:DNA polymerase-1